jgi:ATP-dependent Clp protease ATP-binding subunit ClpA
MASSNHAFMTNNSAECTHFKAHFGLSSKHDTSHESFSSGKLLLVVKESSALTELARAGFDPTYGARPLKRAIQQELENPLAKAILEKQFAAKDAIRVMGEDGKIVFGK